MKQLFIVILCCMVALVCCTTKHTDTVSGLEKENEDAVRADGIHDTVIATDNNTDNNVNEDFISFIKRFHTDTIFQYQRIEDDCWIHGYYISWLSEKDTVVEEYYSIPSDSLNIDDLKVCLGNLNWIFKTPETLSECAFSIQSDSVLIEHFLPTKADLTYEKLVFRRKGQKWFLSEIYSDQRAHTLRLNYSLSEF